VKYAEIEAYSKIKNAVVVQGKIRNNKYADRLVSLVQEINVAADELVNQELLQINLHIFRLLFNC